MTQKQQTKILNLHSESHAIPFDKVIEAVDFMEYGSTCRVMFEMLFLTGCRMSELDRMKISKFYGQYLYWALGKNQRSHRKEKLPKWYIEELKVYRNNHKVFRDKLFGINAHTFRRYFARDIRPNLSPAWQEKTLFQRKGALNEEYVLQLKGLRKDFQTLVFKKELDKWKDSGVALEFASKRVKHSSTHITSYHYLCNFEQLGVEKYKNLEPHQILKQANQKRLLDFIK